MTLMHACAAAGTPPYRPLHSRADSSNLRHIGAFDAIAATSDLTRACWHAAGPQFACLPITSVTLLRFQRPRGCRGKRSVNSGPVAALAC